MECQRVRIGGALDVEIFLRPAGELGIARPDDDDVMGS
jgi:hypothetical protein